MENIGELLQQKYTTLVERRDRLSQELSEVSRDIGDCLRAARLFNIDLPEKNEKAPFNKPEGLPSVPEMIVEILAEKSPATPQHMLEAVKKRWWPKASSNDIGPIAWRMAQQGKLQKTGVWYSLPRPETALRA